jgi:hypothetical protein
MTKKYLVIMDSNGLSSGDVVSKKRPPKAQDVGLPPRKTCHEVHQGWMPAEVLGVPVSIMGIKGQVDELRRFLASWSPIFARSAGTYAWKLLCRFEGIKDTLNWPSAFF